MLRVSPLSIVAWFEIWGGVWGVSASLFAIYHRWSSLDLNFFISTVLAIAYFTVAGMAGLWLQKGRRLGWRLSKIVLLTQVVQITLPGIAYAAYAGSQVSVGVHGWTLHAFFDIGSLFRVRLTSHPPYGLAVNLLAIIALRILAKSPS